MNDELAALRAERDRLIGLLDARHVRLPTRDGEPMTWTVGDRAEPPRPAYIIQQHTGRFHLFPDRETADRWCHENNAYLSGGYMGLMSVQEWIWHPAIDRERAAGGAAR